MKTRTFLAFVGPSLLMMFVFIAAPLVYVLWQSFHLTQQQFETVEVETCTPGFLTQTCVTERVSRPRLDTDGNLITETRWVGWNNYKSVVEPERLSVAFASGAWADILKIDFWRALRFTLMFTVVTLPLVLGVGLAIALAVNNATRAIRGPVIFVSLLPFIITPVIGALAIRWLFVGDGIATTALEHWLERDIAMFAESWTIELLMLFYRVWHVAPFAFVVFYAGLQTVDQDTLESAIMDGASRFERLRYVVLPHLAPLIVFVGLIHLMDAYRVFEEVIGLRTEAHVISLQYLTFDYLNPDDSGNRSIARAAANSMLTMIGIVILLIPLLRRTWRDHRGRR